MIGIGGHTRSNIIVQSKIQQDIKKQCQYKYSIILTIQGITQIILHRSLNEKNPHRFDEPIQGLQQKQVTKESTFQFNKEKEENAIVKKNR